MEVQVFPAPNTIWESYKFMHGINGIISIRPAEQLEPFVRQMTQEMVQEKSTGGDAIVNECVAAAIGWPRQVDDLNKTCPVWSQTRDCCALVYGEHFPDAGDRICASGEDHNLAAYVLRGYEKRGAKVLERLNGWFCGILMDFQQHKVIIFNDRYGLGRIYCHQAPDGFYFSSQAKALLKVLPSLKQLDTRSVGEFLSCDCVLQDRALFRGVSVLPAGSAWTFRRGVISEKRRYFNPMKWEDQPRLSAEHYHQSLRRLFPKVLKRYLQHPVGLAMSLTGGLDGRLVMAWSGSEPGDLPCYTFGSCFGETADVRIAREVASVCRQPYTELRVEGEFFSQFPQLAEETIRLSDGAMDVTGAAELYVNRLARNIRPVRLTGNYGSEILRGNIAFRPHRIFESLFNGDLIQATRQAETTYAEESRGNRRSFIAFKQVPWHHFARSAVEKSQLTVRSPYLDNDLVALSFQAPEADQTNFDICLKIAAEGNFKLAGIPTDRGVRYGASTLLNRWRESKERFLARAEYAYDYGMPHWLARVDRLLSPLRLERVFLGRQKFCHFRTWYRGRLAPYVTEMLLDSRSMGRPYLRRREVEQMVAHHVQGRGNFTTEIHKLLTLELTQRLLLERT